ncbi:TetR/AcrR family transcriptional regulator [Actinopolyspora saharensis]|uniref:DNA-binding transcriptional regulator, AcrR family n=1 Tax=Actinopolyspora saharensis TaxID=995062 RepID=A0A1H1G9B3_9ACTN|nr:TetR/AcrR family transcriptional regulator [Actinopolyspora saharensis]SDR09780.1 DNA-binding transcriptional regulator, AcrR family [Actinopolyspora saharensis]
MTSNAAEQPPASPRTPSRREQILGAAADLFARYGFHGVGIDDIGAAVGVSGPALYRHFRSKDAMLGEMLTGISEKLLRGGRARTTSTPNPAEALESLVRWHIEFALTNSALITVHLRDLDSLTEPDRHRVRELQRGYVEVWVQTLLAVRPEMDEDTARAATHAVLGLINSTPHSARLDTGTMSELLHRMAMGALNTEPEPG